MLNRIFLLLVLIVAFFLRFYRLDSYGIFYDEKATLLISQGICMDAASNQLDIFNKPTFTPQDFWKPKTVADFNEAITRGDIGNSPAYYVVLMGWEKIFGLTDLSIRSLSVLFSVALILLLYIFIKTHWGSQKIALIASFLATIEPFFIAYSHQARNYSMSFFLTLLATHIFLNIVKKEKTEPAKYSQYVMYGIVCGLCLLSHFLTFTVFVGHGLYVLLFVRKQRPWLLLPLALCVGVGMMAIWMTYGGGQWTLRSLAGQAKFYHDIAHSVPNTYAGYIDPATPKNVIKRVIPITADLSIFSNGLGNQMLGKKNIILAFILGIIVCFCLFQYRKNAGIGWQIIPVLLLILGYFFFTINPWHFLEASVFLVLLYLLGQYWYKEKDPEKKQMMLFWAILSVLPLAVLVVFSFKNGHTFGLTPRYQGFAFPYAIILASIAITELWKQPDWFKFPILGIILVQMVYVKSVLGQIYSDTSPKYCYFGTARAKNPHEQVALKIQEVYQKGDTLVYPSFTKGTYSEYEKRTISYLDAQLINVHLPKTAQYIQQVNPNEPNKVILKRNGKADLVLFDFEGTKYRY